MDQFVLLCVEYVVARDGIDLDWNKVAALLRDDIDVSGEAIKQHLIKVRQTREEAGQPVPPKLGRGEKAIRIATAPKRRKRSAMRSRAEYIEDSDDEDFMATASSGIKNAGLIYQKPSTTKIRPTVLKLKKNATPSTPPRKRAIKVESDSDDEAFAKKAKLNLRTSGSTKGSGKKQTPWSSRSSNFSSKNKVPSLEAISASKKPKTEVSSMRLRHVEKVNYAEQSEEAVVDEEMRKDEAKAEQPAITDSHSKTAQRRANQLFSTCNDHFDTTPAAIDTGLFNMPDRYSMEANEASSYPAIQFPHGTPSLIAPGLPHWHDTSNMPSLMPTVNGQADQLVQVTEGPADVFAGGSVWPQAAPAKIPGRSTQSGVKTGSFWAEQVDGQHTAGLFDVLQLDTDDANFVNPNDMSPPRDSAISPAQTHEAQPRASLVDGHLHGGECQDNGGWNIGESFGGMDTVNTMGDFSGWSTDGIDFFSNQSNTAQPFTGNLDSFVQC